MGGLFGVVVGGVGFDVVDVGCFCDDLSGWRFWMDGVCMLGCVCGVVGVL